MVRNKKGLVRVTSNKEPGLIGALFLIALVRGSQHIKCLLRKNESLRTPKRFGKEPSGGLNSKSPQSRFGGNSIEPVF